MSRLLPLLIGLPALLLSLPAQAAYERTLSETFAVVPDHRVQVQLSGGSIQVTVIDEPVVRVRLQQEVRAPNEAAADAFLAEHDITLAQQGDTVSLRVNAPRASGIGFRPRHSARFTAHLEVPAHVALELRTAGGNISLQGRHAHTLNARTSGGSFRIEASEGPADLRTSGGSIRVDHVGDTMRLTTSGGSIRVGTVHGPLRASTSGGSIRVDHVGTGCTGLEASTSGGSIDLGLDPAGDWDLDASTSGGSVRLRDLTLQTTTLSRQRAVGTINAGGTTVRARTSGGSVTVKASTR
jgi:hypothetical protein